MREIKLIVTLEVDDCESDTKIDRGTMQAAAVEAVENVLRHATGAGFPHARENDLSICFVDAVAYEDVD